MRKNFKRMLLVSLCFMLLMPLAAAAYGTELYYENPEDLPLSIGEALPEDGSFLFAEGSLDAVMAALEWGEGGVEAWIFERQQAGDGYRLTSKSAVFPVLEGAGARVGFTGDTFLLMYDEGARWPWSYYFHKDDMGRWMLRGIDNQACLSAFWAFYTAQEAIEGQYERYVCGSYPFERDLAYFDARNMPRTAQEAFELVDTQGYAMVKSNVKTDRLHLRAAPSKGAVSLGRYYSGTPLKVLEDEGLWVRVSIAGREGYMSREFLAFGEEMKTVVRYFPSLNEKAQVVEELRGEVFIYAEPRPGAQVLAGYDEARIMHFVADIGEDWYHVLCEDGLSGYVMKKYFWAGNG